LKEIRGVVNLLNAELNKLPVNSQAFIDKTKEVQKAEGVYKNVRDAVKGTADSLSDLSKKAADESFFGKLKGSWVAVTGAIAGVGVAMGGLIKFGKDVINSSHTLQDKWEEMSQGMKFAWDKFLSSLASGDFSNLFLNFQKAYDAGVKYAQILDDIAEKQLGYNITQAEDKEKMASLIILMRSRLQTDEQRIEYGKQYLALQQKISGQVVSQANSEIEANRILAELKTGLGIATVKNIWLKDRKMMH